MGNTLTPLTPGVIPPFSRWLAALSISSIVISHASAISCFVAATKFGSLAYLPSPSDIKTFERENQRISELLWRHHCGLYGQTHCFNQTGGTASLLVELAVVLRWHLQVDGWIRPEGEIRVVCVPGALAHRHLAAAAVLPVEVLHADERGVVRGLVITGRGGGRGGPGTCGAGRREAVGSAGVQACYGHDLAGRKRVGKCKGSHSTFLTCREIPDAASGAAVKLYVGVEARPGCSVCADTQSWRMVSCYLIELRVGCFHYCVMKK